MVKATEAQKLARVDEIEDRVERVDRLIELCERQLKFLHAVRENPDLLDDVVSYLGLGSLPSAAAGTAAPAPGALPKPPVDSGFKPTDQGLVDAIKDVIPRKQKARVASIVTKLKERGVVVSLRDVDRVLRSSGEFEKMARGWWMKKPTEFDEVPF